MRGGSCDGQERLVPAGSALELTAVCHVEDEWWHETYVHDGAFAEGSNGQLIPVLDFEASIKVD